LFSIVLFEASWMHHMFHEYFLLSYESYESYICSYYFLQGPVL